MSALLAIGAGVAVITGIGAGLGIGHRCDCKTAGSR